MSTIAGDMLKTLQLPGAAGEIGSKFLISASSSYSLLFTFLHRKWPVQSLNILFFHGKLSLLLTSIEASFLSFLNSQHELFGQVPLKVLIDTTLFEIDLCCTSLSVALSV